MYDLLLGGRDSYRADRELAASLLKLAPWLRDAARINRAHGARAATVLAERGIRQFLDLGCGYPSPKDRCLPNVYQAVAGVDPGCVVVHVDRHPVVAAHADALLVGPAGAHPCVRADISDIECLLAAPQIHALDWESRSRCCCTTYCRGSPRKR